MTTNTFRYDKDSIYTEFNDAKSKLNFIDLENIY